MENAIFIWILQHEAGRGKPIKRKLKVLGHDVVVLERNNQIHFEVC